jgi:hypothetical protein
MNSLNCYQHHEHIWLDMTGDIGYLKLEEEDCEETKRIEELKREKMREENGTQKSERTNQEREGKEKVAKTEQRRNRLQ